MNLVSCHLAPYSCPGFPDSGQMVKIVLPGGFPTIAPRVKFVRGHSLKTAADKAINLGVPPPEILGKFPSLSGGFYG